MSSYQVFARKYRPQTFDQVVGQEHITQTLKNAIATNRLAHAYLFVGPRGTGKTSTARILAKGLNCIHGPTVTPCGECDACREIAAGNSLDVMEIDGASNNGVEQVRELRENVRFAPTRGKFKIYIIDEVHMLSTAAFNALLKTLEEPPAHVKFVFATTDVQKVLPTILSRCQRFDLRRIPAELIANHLQYIAENERITLEPEAARAIAKGAEGGLRDAESMLDQLVAFCGEAIAEGDVLSVFGFTASQTVSDLCSHILDGDNAAALGIVQRQAEAGRDLSRLMADLISHLRNVLVAKADPEGIQAEVGPDILEILQAQAERLSMERLLDLIEQFAAAEGRMKWASNKKLHFEIAVIKAVQTLGQATLTEVLDTLAVIKTGGELPELPAKSRPQLPAAKPLPKSQDSPPPARRSLVEAFRKEIGISAPKPESNQAAPTPTHRATVPEPAPKPEPQPEPPVSKPEPSAPKPDAKSPNPSFESLASAPTAASNLSTAACQSPLPEERPTDDPPPLPDTGTFSLFGDSFFTPVQEPPAPVPVVNEQPEGDASESVIEEPSAPSCVLDATVTADIPAGTAADPDLWPKFIREVREKKPFIHAWVESGTLIGMENNVCIIGFPEEAEFPMESLDKPNQRKFLEETLSRLTGQPITVKLELRPGLVVVPVHVPKPEPELPADPMEQFKNDPLIRHALELFKAEIQVG